MKTAIFMSVYNRPAYMLAECLRSVLDAVPEGASVIVVDDASSNADFMSEHPVSTLASHKNFGCLRTIRTDTTALHKDAYSIDGYNNPAHAFNTGLEAALRTDPRAVFIMSSDCIIPSDTFKHVERFKLDDTIYCATVRDQQTKKVWCGVHRHWPLPWFLGTAAKHFRQIRWDLNFLHGIGFEDNDFSARLFLKVGGLVIDRRVEVVHQSHADTAQSDKLVGHYVNKGYMAQKWGHVPFGRADRGLIFDNERYPDFVYLTNPRAPFYAERHLQGKKKARPA